MAFDFIQDNFVAVAIVSFLMLFVLTNSNFEKRTNRLFLAAAICVAILIFEEAWEAQLAMGTKFTPLRLVLSALGYSLRPLVAYLLIMIGKRYTKKGALYLVIPLIVNTLVAFSSLFCGISFGYSADNQFVRGPLGYTPFLVAGFYVAILLTLTLKQCRNGGRKEAMIVSAIVLLAFISTVMESLFHFRFIQNPCIGLSITFYYLFLHTNRNNRDPLTGALTRRRFYLDAEKYHTTLTAVVSLDLNNLKTLNDKYGHTEGDKALIAITNIIKRDIGTRAGIYRTGGDEFMILCFKLSEKNVQEMIEKIREDLAKTKYRCAIGYALYSSQMQFEHVCQLADKVMYENKRQMKSQTETECMRQKG